MSLICAGGFLVLFPGFFFYHTLIGRGLMPAFLGGFFRPMALVFIFAAACVALLAKKAHVNRPGPAGMLYLCVLAWTAVVAIWHYLIGTQVGNLEMLDWSLSGIALCVACYLISRYIPLHPKIFKATLFACLSGMVLIVMFLATDGMFYLTAEGLAEEKTASYQGFARSLAITGILLVAIAPRGWFRVALAVATTVALFLNGARSEFVCFVLALLALWAAYAVWRRGSAFPMVMLIALIALLPFLSLEAVQQVLPENRQLQLFDLGTATSAIVRLELAQAGWEEIGKSPLFGSYGFYYNKDGVGSYPHDLSAAWVNLGLPGFVGYLILFTLLVALPVNAVRKGCLSSPVVSVALLTSVFALVAVLFAKDYTYVVIALAVGFTDRMGHILESGISSGTQGRSSDGI